MKLILNLSRDDNYCQWWWFMRVNHIFDAIALETGNYRAICCTNFCRRKRPKQKKILRAHKVCKGFWQIQKCCLDLGHCIFEYTEKEKYLQLYFSTWWMEVSESKFTFVGNPCDYHVKPTIALIEAIKKGATEKTEMRLANNFLYITSEARHKW